MKQIFRTIAGSGLLIAALGLPAKADVVLGGPDSNDGSYSTTALAGLAATDGTVAADGVTGISLWAFLGGMPASGSSPVYGAITTSTPAGDNGKNAILRYYLVATNATGQQSVVSLGEIDPSFGGTASPAPFIAYTNTGGTQLAQPQLVVPSQPGRGLSNVTSLQLLSVSAAPQLPEGVTSTAIQLSGAVNAPASYGPTQLQNNFTPVHEAVNGDTYTAVPLWTFLNPTNPGSTNQIVTVHATDGLVIALALAELDPSLDAVACGPGVTTCDILPYADTGTNFLPGADGLARVIFPTDNQHGRWSSNVDAINVSEVPEPATLTLFGLALAATARLRRRIARD